jgi:dihydroneopterin aldolase
VSIGFYDIERQRRQRVLLDIDVFVPLSISTPLDDQPGEVVDYDFVRRAVVGLTADRHFNLQETLLECVVRAVLDKPGVRAVRAISQKPDVYPGAMTVGIEVFRFGANPPQARIADDRRRTPGRTGRARTQQAAQAPAAADRPGDRRLQHDRGPRQGDGLPVGRQGQLRAARPAA